MIQQSAEAFRVQNLLTTTEEMFYTVTAPLAVRELSEIRSRLDTIIKLLKRRELARDELRKEDEAEWNANRQG